MSATSDCFPIARAMRPGRRLPGRITLLLLSALSLIDLPAQVITPPPRVEIISPAPGVTSQPMIQLHGRSRDALSAVSYDVLNENGTTIKRGERGYGSSPYEFDCYDIDLRPGTNTIVLRCTDRAENTLVTNLVYVFSTTGDTQPPKLEVAYPRDGARIHDSELTLDGTSDDPTATVVALVSSAEGHADLIEGLVERHGKFWVEHLPLRAPPTCITVIATDAAHNSSLTNLTIRKSRYQLLLSIPHGQELWQKTVTVTGFSDRPGAAVRVNGVLATVETNGHFTATNVPVTEGGTASFIAEAIPKDGREEEDEIPTNAPPPILWGEPTNMVRAGISFPPPATNQFNHYRCNLEVQNVSGTNMNREWMLPREPFRYRLRLLDRSGKQVPGREPGKATGAALPTNLDIHHLGRKEIGYIDGVAPLATNAPFRLATLKLMEHFVLNAPGDYRLEIEPRLFRIAEDGRLQPFALPPLTARLTIAAQPSEMTFFLESLHRQGRLVWGQPQNQLRIGLLHDRRFTSPRTFENITVFLANQGTNDLLNLRLPAPEESFEVTLFDASGREVGRTPLGRRQGQPLSLDDGRRFGIFRNYRRFRPLFVRGADACQCLSFELRDYFKITKPGKYRLTYQQRLWQPLGQGQVKGVVLPMVMLPVEILDGGEP